MSTTKIWDDFHDRLFGFISARINNTEDAKDILQDVFVKIHKKSSSIKDQTKITSWIYQITRNTIIDFYRKNKIKSDENAETLELSIPESVIPKDLSKCLIPFVKNLPEKYREAYEATELGRLSQKEYALKNNLSYSAAKSRVQRAKKMLREDFKACCHIEADIYGNIVSSDCDC